MFVRRYSFGLQFCLGVTRVEDPERGRFVSSFAILCHSLLLQESYQLAGDIEFWSRICSGKRKSHYDSALRLLAIL